MGASVAFKDCSRCHHRWPDMGQFVRDRSLVVNGYQASMGTPEEGLFLVTHDEGDCGTTLGVVAGDMKVLYHGPVYAEFCGGTDQCNGLCLDEGRLEECSAPCAMAWVRVVLQYLRRHEMPEGER
jgi:hypothetical protein